MALPYYSPSRFKGSSSSDAKLPARFPEELREKFSEKYKVLEEDFKKEEETYGARDFLDDTQRPSQAILQGLSAGIETVATGQGNVLVESAKGFKRGITKTGTEKFGSDIIKEAMSLFAPDLVRTLDEETNFEIAGIEFDAFSLPGFALEMFIDPLNSKKFLGALKSGGSFAKQLAVPQGKKALSFANQLAKNTLGESYERIAMGAANKAATVAGVFNTAVKAKIVQKIAKNFDGLADDVPDAQKIVLEGIEDVKNINARVKNLAAGLQTDMSSEDLQKTGKALFEVADDMKNVIFEDVANDFGTSVAQVAYSNTFQNVLDELTLVATARNNPAMYDELIGKGLIRPVEVIEADLQDAMTKMFSNPDVAQEVFGAKTFQDLVKNFEVGTITKEVAKTGKPENLGKVLAKYEFESSAKMARDLAKGQSQIISQTASALAKEKKLLKTARNTDLRTINKAFGEDLKRTISVVDSSVKNFYKTLSLGGEMYDPGEMVNTFSKAYKTLEKYAFGANRTAFSAKFQGNLKRFDKLRSIVTQSRNATDEGLKKALRQEANDIFKAVKRDFVEFKKVQQSAFKTLSSSDKSAELLRREILSNFDKRITDIDSDILSLSKEAYKVSTGLNKTIGKMKQTSVRNAVAYSKYFKTTEIAGALNKKVAQNKKIYDKMFYDKMAEKVGPEGADLAMKIRSASDEQLAKMRDLDIMNDGELFYVRRKIEDDAARNFMREGISSAKGGSGASFLKKRSFVYSKETIEWAEKNGMKIEYDPVKSYLEAFQQSENVIAKERLKQGLIKAFGVQDKIQTKRVVKNVGTAQLAEMKSRKVDAWTQIGKKYPEIQNVFNDIFNPNSLFNMDNPLGGILKGSQWATKIFHFFNTLPNPAFHVVNQGTVPFLVATQVGAKQAFNPATLVDALKTYSSKADGVIKAVVDGNVVEYSMKEIVEDFAKSSFFKSGFYDVSLNEADNMLYKQFGKSTIKNAKKFINGDTKAKERAAAALGTAADGFKAVLYTGLEVAQRGEELGRRFAYIAALKSGKNKVEAMEAAKKALFDYNWLGNPFDLALSKIIPFYTFQRKLVPQQLKYALENPQHFTVMANTLDKISNLEDLNSEELELLNTFDADSFFVLKDTVNGVRELRKFNFLPTPEAFRTMRMVTDALQGKPQALVNRATPMLVSFLNNMYKDSDSFTGRELSNKLPEKMTPFFQAVEEKLPGGAEALEKLGLVRTVEPKYFRGKVVGTKEIYTGNKNTIHLIKSGPFGRILNFAGQMASGKDLFGAITGANVIEFDKDTAKYFRNKEFETRLNELLKEYGAKESTPRMYFPKRK